MGTDNMIQYGKYLASLMGSTINSISPEKPFENINWDILYTLAEHHNVIGLIYPAVSAFDVPADILKKFVHSNNLIIAREARQEIESQRIFQILNSHDIRFIKLKGIVIKNLYPMPYMRTSSDIDICMRKNDRERSRTLMAEAGYTLDTSIDYHDEYSKNNFFIYELHSSITSSKSEYAQLFSEPFSKSITDSDGTNYQLHPNYFYLHLLIHLLNHFVTGGCGIRQLCDLYIFEKAHPDLDMDFIGNITEDYQLTEFFNTIRNLSCSLFESKELSKDETDIADFIFRSGERGSTNLRHISWLSDDKHITWTFGKKCKYFISLWFPGVSTMKKRYPILEKLPFLLPFCWITRIFRAVFRNRNALKEQRNEIRRLNSDELKEAKRIRKLAGLK